MLSIQSDFDGGKNEVNSYFNFLKNVDLGNIHLTDSTGIVSFRIDTELEKILKANAFLLLYNLIEATLRNGLWEIHTSIKSEGVDYRDLERQIKEILVGDQVRARFEYNTRSESVTTTVYEIIEKILYIPTTLHPAEKYKVRFNAGNLDIDTIHQTFKNYGINTVPINHNDQKEAFTNTKSNRNHLAHGNKTFNECGKEYSFIQLERYKDEIFEYLQRALDAIDNFITLRSYRKITPALTTSVTVM